MGLNSFLSSATGGLVSGVLGGAANMAYNWLSGDAASNKQWRRQIKMFRWTNEYNSPVNQMKRLKEAGLNPNLVYGSGGVGAGNTTSFSPNASRPEYGSGAFDAIARYQNFAQNALNMKMTQAQLALIDQQAKESFARTQSHDQDVLSKIWNRWRSKSFYPFELRKLDYNNQLIMSRKLLNDSIYGLNTDTLYNTRPLIRGDLEARIALNKARTAREWFRYDYGDRYDAYRSYWESRVVGKDADQYLRTGLRPSDPYFLRLPYRLYENIRSYF